MRLSGLSGRLGGGLVGRPGFLAVLVNPGRPGFGRLVVGLGPLGLLCACLSGLNKEGGEEADDDGDGDDDDAHAHDFPLRNHSLKAKGDFPPF